MPVLIGGSPSTGSSLLRQMLNRHSAIYCGPETQLFTHPQLFEKWEGCKKSLLHKPLIVAPDIQLIRGANLTGIEQGWEREELLTLIEESHEFDTFCDTYFSRTSSRNGKRIWMDKTPSNVLTFEAFLNRWPQARVVHIVRDPLDVVASLCQRGLSLFVAVSRFLFNTAHALVSENNRNYHLINYEKLVTSPHESLQDLLESLLLSFESSMIEKGNARMVEPDQMSGWLSSELDQPNKKSVGRFHALPGREQSEIIAALHTVRLSPDYAARNDLDWIDASSIAIKLGYVIPEAAPNSEQEVVRSLRHQKNRYRQKCLAERRLFFEREKPIVLARNF